MHDKNHQPESPDALREKAKKHEGRFWEATGLGSLLLFEGGNLLLQVGHDDGLFRGIGSQVKKQPFKAALIIGATVVGVGLAGFGIKNFFKKNELEEQANQAENNLWSARYSHAAPISHVARLEQQQPSSEINPASPAR